MKQSRASLSLKALLPALYLVTAFQLKAQPPVCFGPGTGLIYYLTNTQIMQFDPTAPVSATNPVANTIPMPPGGGGGLAVSTNLNGPGPSPTFYIVGGATGTYMYWDGTAWVNTGHTWSAVNPGGAGPYIYTLNGGTGQVYRYDGTGNDVLVTTISSFASGGPYDLAGDNCGNFYLLRMNNNPSGPYLNKYDPAGNLLVSYTVTGSAPVGSGGGMGIIGNTVYCHNIAGMWIGTISGTNVSFTLLPGAPAISPNDFGTCALGSVAFPPKASIDTGYYCGAGPGIPISVTGGTPVTINWSVMSGSATITGSGGSISVTATTDAKILMDAVVIDPCGTAGIVAGKDTVTIIIPTATLDAGNNFTTYGCGNYVDTINATLTNHKTWMQYNIAWTPASNVLAAGTTLTPVINPQADTWFKVTLATKASQGGCAWSDSVLITLVNADVKAAFDVRLNFGCTEDTVVLTDNSTSALGALKYYWTWGDTSAADITKNPVHIYKEQNFYQIVQYTDNGNCRDTVYKTVDLNHPLVAQFDFAGDKICQGEAVNFNGSTSIISLPRTPAKWWWYFGDGVTDTIVDPAHTYPDSRVYSPTLVVFDALGCSDTVSHTIDNIIPLPYVDLGPKDTLICNGEPLHLPVGISARGDKWVWNDGSEQPKKIVTKNGTYIVRLYNECGFGADTINVVVKDCTIFFPNAFSPNGDGKNDLASIIGNTFDVTTYEMAIFNRWGARVYYTQSKESGWDGTYKGEPQPTGTYYYFVKYTTHGQDYEMKGDIILVR